MGGLRGAGGPGADHRPGPYALRANIDLFYTPGEILYGKRETQQLPAAGPAPARRRDGDARQRVRRDPDSLKVNFSLYDAEGSVDGEL